jgi:hypothetical protein
MSTTQIVQLRALSVPAAKLENEWNWYYWPGDAKPLDEAGLIAAADANKFGVVIADMARAVGFNALAVLAIVALVSILHFV